MMPLAYQHTDGKTYHVAEVVAQEMRNEDSTVFGLVMRVNNIPAGMSAGLYDHLRPVILQYLIDQGVIPPDSEQVRHNG